MPIALVVSTHTLVSTGAILLVVGSILAIAVAATDAEWFLPVSVAMVGAGTSLTMIPTLEENSSALTVPWQIVAAIAVVAVLAFVLAQRRRPSATRVLGDLDANKKNDDDHGDQNGPEALADLCERSHRQTMDVARTYRPVFRLLAAVVAGAMLSFIFAPRRVGDEGGGSGRARRSSDIPGSPATGLKAASSREIGSAIASCLTCIDGRRPRKGAVPARQ